VNDSPLPADLKQFAAREFIGEQMLWAEKPDMRIAAFLSFGIWLFAIPWTAFALFWESMVVGPLLLHMLGYEVKGPTPQGGMIALMVVMGIFGLPFVAIGFAMLATPFVKLWKGGRTVYVLTNKRLAIIEGGRKIDIVSIRPADVVSLSRKEGPDGRGTLILHQGFTVDSDGDRQERKTELGVVHDVRKLELTIRGWMDRAAKA
jgi:hypothetical protein